MKKFRAVFYFRDDQQELQEKHVVSEAKSLAAFKRLAKETARINGWRLVEVYEEAP